MRRFGPCWQQHLAAALVGSILFSIPALGIVPSGAIEESAAPLEAPVGSIEDWLIGPAEQAIHSLVSEDRREMVRVLRVSMEENPEVYVLHTVSWVQFVEKVRISGPVEKDDALAVERIRDALRSKMLPEPLQRPIIERSIATEALRACHPALEAVVIPPRPPFFNNPTGIHWDSARDHLALEATATIDSANNKCVRGVVDLRTAEVVCIRDMACVVR